jgi:hypothetical protein
VGPSKRWGLAFVVSLGVLYWPLTRGLEPLLREAWFRTVTRALAVDARPLAPPPDELWLGASRPELPHSLYGVYELEALLGRPLAIASFYQAWGDGDEHAFPRHVLDSLRDGGYLPMLTWEPWLGAFARFAGTNPPGSLRRIARGELDAFIRAWARDAVRFGHPLLLRLGHEPTNAWYGWAPEHGNDAADYRAFWARVHDIFRAEGARNVSFVWTPFSPYDHAWFPGAQRVDWIGFDVFNYGTASEAGSWADFRTRLRPLYAAYAWLGPKLLVAEVATASAGGDKGEWLRTAFRSLATQEFPGLRAFVLFDQPHGRSPTGQPIDWSLAEVPGLAEAWSREPELLARFTRERPHEP